MIAMTPTISPPAPRPCSARNPISSAIPCDVPDSAEPARKMTIEVRKMFFRPYRSLILPHSGVETDRPSVYAVTTQDRWDKPPSSPTIRGIAVATIMLSSMASRIASMSPGSTTRRSLRDAEVWTSDKICSSQLMTAYLPTG